MLGSHDRHATEVTPHCAGGRCGISVQPVPRLEATEPAGTLHRRAFESDTLHYAAGGNSLLSPFGHLVHGSRTMLTYGARGGQAEALTSQADMKDLRPVCA